MDGAETFTLLEAVKEQALNLSTSRPLFTPQKSTARQSASVVRFMTNSPLSFIIAYEWRSGRTDTYVIGGSLFTVPVHAAVIMLDFSIVPHDTMTGGSG